jgi:glucan-binding YG repeat protein
VDCFTQEKKEEKKKKKKTPAQQPTEMIFIYVQFDNQRVYFSFFTKQHSLISPKYKLYQDNGHLNYLEN